jgi:hypothetical protein
MSQKVNKLRCQMLAFSTVNREGYREYKSNPKECVNCPLLNQCTNASHAFLLHPQIFVQSFVSVFCKLIYSDPLGEDVEGYREYKSNPKECVNCPLLNQCTKSKNHQRVITRSNASHAFLLHPQIFVQSFVSVFCKLIYSDPLGEIEKGTENTNPIQKNV